MDRMSVIQRSAFVRRLAGHHPRYAVDGEDDDELLCEWEFLQVLLVGAGGLGCELLHTLAMSGFGNITIIDMDTIELSNLNRQFLFREGDIGRPKSEVAAEFVSRRCPGVTVTPIFGRIEDQSDAFYRGFDLIIVGVDSISARRWINAKVAEIAEWGVVRRDPHQRDACSRGGAVMEEEEEEANNAENEENRTVAPLSEYAITRAIPFIDTGTEGFEGHCRLFDLTDGPRRTPCQECVLWTFNEASRQVPMCTLESTPRAPEHCVLYAKVKLWEDCHRDDGVELDTDNVEHVRWVTAEARKRQVQFGIGGAPIDEAFTLGVIKNVVPAVGFTNALISGQAVTEAVKLAMGVARTMDNSTQYNGAVANGVFLSLDHFDPDPQCIICAPRPVVAARPGMTVSQLVDAVCRLKEARQGGLTPGDAFTDATVSLLFPPNAVTTVPSEVILAYKSNNPARKPIVGDMVDVIVRGGANGDVLLEAWRGGSVLPMVRVSANNNTLTAVARYDL